MAWDTQHPQIGDVVTPTRLAERHEVITLPAGRLEHHTTRLALPMSTLEPVLPIPRILRILVRLPVRIPLKPNSLVDLRLMEIAVVTLRRPATHKTRPQPARSLQVLRATRRTVRGAPATHKTRLRPRRDHRVTGSHSEHAADADPTRGKNGLPQPSQIRSRRFSWRSLVSRRSRATSSSCTSRSEIS